MSSPFISNAIEDECSQRLHIVIDLHDYADSICITQERFTVTLECHNKTTEKNVLTIDSDVNYNTDPQIPPTKMT